MIYSNMKTEKFYWLNDDSRTFLKRGYLLEGIEPEERIKQISETAEKILKKNGFADKFYEYMSKGWYSLASPVWSNFGLDRGLPISCYGSYVGDSVRDIMYSTSEVAIMSKYGGGTSGYFGDIRPRGSAIKDNGESNGSFPFLKLFDTTIDVISQGSVRRGYFAAYVDVEHPDIEEWLNIQLEGNPIQLMYYGVCVGDEWLKEMVAGDENKRKIWAKILQNRAEIGVPYLFFKDTVNNNTVDVYKDKGLKIHASNLCIAGDQRVVTHRGYLTAKELYEQQGELILFDGNKAVKASEMKLREKSVQIYKITLDNGMEHRVTGYHKLKKYIDSDETQMVEVNDLRVGDGIAIQTKKGIFGSKDLKKEAFLLGLYQSDGTQHNDLIMLDVWENDFDLIEEIQESFNEIDYKYGCDTYDVPLANGGTATRNRTPAQFTNCTVAQSTVKKKRLTSKTLKKALDFEKGHVPAWIYESNEATQWEYLRGLFYADGTVHISNSKGNPIQINYANINLNFLKELQLIFNNLGLQSSIRLLREREPQLLPNGRGGHSLYNSKDCYRLIIGNKNAAIKIEEKIGFLSRKGISIEKRKYRDNTKKFHRVISIIEDGVEDVYCPTVYDDQHVFVSQGVITSNCSEINLPSNDEQSFVCCLSSMNLLHFDEWKNTDAVETLTYFLDAVMEEFIEKTEDIEFFERAHRFAKNHRALGLGVLGWHDYLMSKMIPFDSFDAMMENNKIFKLLQEKTYSASKQMAIEYGEPEILKGYGRRNTTLMAIAPTKSSSFILGQVSQSIEPIKSNYYVKDLAKSKTTYRNPFLKELLKAKDQDNEGVWASILQRDGSVQHLDFLTNEEKRVFKTFSEISQLSVIQQAGQRQKYIDQSQSLNLMVHPDTSTKDINKLYLTAWELGVKTLYYQHSVNAAQEFSRSLLTCSSCES